jgi:multiple sugar transport system permease protein
LWDEQVKATEAACIHKSSPKEALLDAQGKVQRDLDAFYSQEKYPVVNLWIPFWVFTGAFILVALWLVFAYRRKRLGSLSKGEAKWAYLFISPWIIGFLVFTLGPMLASLFFSFTQYNVLNPARFVGVKNYTDMFTNDWGDTWKAFSNVIYLAGVGVPLMVFTGLAIALLLNGAVRGIRFYRTMFYMPAIVPTVASAVLWIWLLYSDPHRGLINGIWDETVTKWLGLAPPGWLNAEAWSKPSLVFMGAWGAGSGMILWLAGLKGIPTSLYEASSLDGATPRQQFWSVTMPQLSPILFFNVVMGFIGALQEFDRVYIMKPTDSAVGPGESLLTPVYKLFHDGFAYFKMGNASAMAWAIFIFILLLTLAQFALAKNWVHYEVEN